MKFVVSFEIPSQVFTFDNVEANSMVGAIITAEQKLPQAVKREEVVRVDCIKQEYAEAF